VPRSPFVILNLVQDLGRQAIRREMLKRVQHDGLLVIPAQAEISSGWPQ
jgi:hypothetical protein